jgi:hypothetical protein
LRAARRRRPVARQPDGDRFCSSMHVRCMLQAQPNHDCTVSHTHIRSSAPNHTADAGVQQQATTQAGPCTMHDARCTMHDVRCTGRWSIRGRRFALLCFALLCFALLFHSRAQRPEPLFVPAARSVKGRLREVGSISVKLGVRMDGLLNGRWRL